MGQSYDRGLAFIVGSPRSGTTWLQRLLASHPKVHTGQESFLFFTYLGPLLRRWENQLTWKETSGRGPLGLPCYMTTDQFRDVVMSFADDLLDHVLRPVQPGELFVEKTPDHALFVSEIISLLPESKIIHLLRDGRDVTASLLAASRSWGKHWAPKTAQRCAGRWAKYVNAVQRASKDLSRDLFIEVRYESLKEDPAAELRRVTQFLGLEWCDSNIQNAINANSIRNTRSGIATQIPIRGEAAQDMNIDAAEEPTEFVRKGRSGSWRQDLSLCERLRAWKVARHTMQQTGYPHRLRDWL